jgi:hypothetical protein
MASLRALGVARARRIRVKLARWFTAAVLIALVPFGIIWVHLWTHGSAVPRLYELWPHGELLLVCVALAFDASGELIGSGIRARLFKVICGCLCAVVGALAAGAFSDAQFSTLPDPIKLSKLSLYVFACTIALSGGCKALAEVQ